MATVEDLARELEEPTRQLRRLNKQLIYELAFQRIRIDRLSFEERKAALEAEHERQTAPLLDRIAEIFNNPPEGLS